jgi:hypothetical protein
MDVRLDISSDGGELFVRGNLLLGALPLTQYALRCFLIVPKIGFGDAGFERLQAFPVARRVKDSSARARCAVSVLRSDAANLRGSFESF